MHEAAGQCDTWVFHAGGALGDFVLAWPFLRRLMTDGRKVALVSAWSKAQLAQMYLGVHGVNEQAGWCTQLWRADPVALPVFEAARRVVALNVPEGEAGATWRRNAAAVFPGAAIEVDHRRLNRVHAAELGQPTVTVPRRVRPEGPVVLHVGAGSAGKRWALEHWVELKRHVEARGGRTLLAAGEVEHECFSAAEHARFAAAGGRFFDDPLVLAACLSEARYVVVADSGPGHLAAQLGVPTLVLFGPTDWRAWKPLGPAVWHVAPAQPTAMDWLEPPRVWDILDQIMDERPGGRPPDREDEADPSAAGPGPRAGRARGVLAARPSSPQRSPQAC